MEVLYEREAGELPGQPVRAPPDILTGEEGRVVFVDSVIGSRTPVHCQV
jgi:hypothetical protein